jgi:hypothetical protein
MKSHLYWFFCARVGVNKHHQTAMLRIEQLYEISATVTRQFMIYLRFWPWDPQGIGGLRSTRSISPLWEFGRS